MRRPFRRIAASLAVASALAGCAVPRHEEKPVAPWLADIATAPAEGARVAAPGASKDAVARALGPAQKARFDSGFEVWVYPAARRADESEPAEFVVLFDPAGMVRKSRWRPATAAAK